MSPRNSFKLFAPSVLAVAVSATMAPAVSAAEGLTLEEVLVNARKTEESMQDVSVAVTAFTGDDIDDKLGWRTRTKMRDLNNLERITKP